MDDQHQNSLDRLEERLGRDLERVREAIDLLRDADESCKEEFFRVTTQLERHAALMTSLQDSQARLEDRLDRVAKTLLHCSENIHENEIKGVQLEGKVRSIYTVGSLVAAVIAFTVNMLADILFQ